MNNINENEKQFICRIVEMPDRIKAIQEQLKEQYNMDSVFNEDTLELVLATKGMLKESVDSIKDIINQDLDGFITVIG